MADPGEHLRLRASGRRMPQSSLPMPAPVMADPGERFRLRASGHRRPQSSRPMPAPVMADPGEHLRLRASGHRRPQSLRPMPAPDPGKRLRLRASGHRRPQSSRPMPAPPSVSLLLLAPPLPCGRLGQACPANRRGIIRRRGHHRLHRRGRSGKARLANRPWCQVARDAWGRLLATRPRVRLSRDAVRLSGRRFAPDAARLIANRHPSPLTLWQGVWHGVGRMRALGHGRAWPCSR